MHDRSALFSTLTHQQDQTRYFLKIGYRRALMLLVICALACVIYPGLASAKTEEKTPTLYYRVNSYSCPYPGFSTMAAAVACAAQEADANNSICRFTGGYTQVDVDSWSTPVNCYYDGFDQPPTLIDPFTVGGVTAVCEPGYIEVLTDGTQSHKECWIQVVERDVTVKRPPDFCTDNPCIPGTGEKRRVETDYAGTGGSSLQFVRTYRSLTESGPRWLHNFDRSLEWQSGSHVLVHRPDQTLTFDWGGSAWVPDADVHYSLNSSATAVISPDGSEVENYDYAGRLASVRDAAGNLKQSLEYSDASTPSSVAPAEGLLIEVSDPFGHALHFTYDSQSRLQTMTDPAGGVYTYAYDADSNLTSVTYPGSVVRQYVYNEPAYTAATSQPHALTGIVDENSQRFANFGYNAAGLVVLSELAGGAERIDITYPSLSTIHTDVSIDVPYNTKYITRYYEGGGSASLSDAAGATRSVGFAVVLGVPRFAGMSTPCAKGCSQSAGEVTFDGNGNVASRTDFNGNETTYTYDMTRNLEISRTEALGTSRARTIGTSWDGTFRLPRVITELNRATAYTYDTAGKVLTRTVTDTSASPAVERTWTYTYDSYGHVLTKDGPRTDVSDVTSYTYYSCDTGYECGEVETVADALGQMTSYLTYNAHGQPLTISDANGVVTTLTYDTRARLTSQAVGSETTAFEYWPTGLLKKVILPDASYLQYTYDNAHRLFKIEDGLGNRLQYTLDAMGNHTAENAYDPSSTLARTRAQVFNSLNQRWKQVGAAGTAAVTTVFGYDSNGNQVSTAASLSRTTANQYDELNRLKQITDPASGVTAFGYDANDNLTSVTDPRSLTTSYAYDGFGDLTGQVSPDTGTTTNTYDSGGNLATATDARGVVTTYSYDELNRVTTAAFTLGGTTDQTISYTYDAGTNGKGHLTGASDANHSLAWTYDAQGRVTGKAQTVGSVVHSVGYAYTNGNLTSLTTPSGQTIGYGYTNGRVSSVTLNGSTTILQNLTYDPFGPVKSWSWGNGTTTTRTYDTDGKITQIATTGIGQTNTYSYDDASRITGIADTTTAANSWTYNYDGLDRVTSAVKTGTTRGWTYDANGNRLSETGSSASTYTVSSTTNRVSSITGALARTYGYDAAGNTLSYAGLTATYNNRGRLKTLANGASTETMVYDALGQRIKTSGGAAGTVLYVYDEAGHLLGEYTSAGALVQETVWLDDMPVATLRPKSGGGVDIFYIHTDHLNTPRRISRPSDNQLRWTWLSDPFGTEAANGNPASLGAFAYNLRFPGQIFDGQGGLHYNYFRTYDPAMGRYIESDPVGLNGGINTYAYAESNPLSFSDMFGLDTYMCTQPLHALGSLGSKIYHPAWYNPLYHQFICVPDGNGGMKCGGQDRQPGVWPWGKGKPSNDSWKPDSCKNVDNNKCVEQCLLKNISSSSRPNYSLVGGGGTRAGSYNCQQWADKQLSQCQQECKAK